MKEKFTKVKEIIKRNDNLIIFILIVLSLIGINLNVNVNNSDELWLFQNIYKIYNGFELYSDINCIITPLFLLIGNAFFKILGANFLTYRIYSIVIQTVLFFTSYLILKRLNIGKLKSAIIIEILLLIGFSMIINGANYNILSLVFLIIGLYLNLKPKKHNTIIQAIIWFLIYLTKQNIAILYGVSLILYELFKNCEKKEKINNIVKEITMFATLVIISLIVMSFNNIFEGFINYAILGLNEFAIENIYINWEKFILMLALIIINIVITTLLLKKKICTENEREKLIILNIFAYPILLTAYPIFNEYHIIIGICPMILLTIFSINILIKNLPIKLKNKYIYIIGIILSIILIGRSGNNFENWKNNIEVDKQHPYYGGVFKNGIIDSVNNVCEYIEENQNRVIVLSSKAAYYNICLKTSNGMLDLPFKGNLGKDGEEGLIETVKKLDNTEILIEKNEENLIYQESLKTRNYIKENFEKIGEIEEFEIYFQTKSNMI